VPCDGILLDGNILINEASLTGESVPVLKVKFDTNVLYNEKIHKNSSVYEGTDIIQITNLTFRGGYVLP
jgi:cation-transporting P-type ATPase 13A2